jgi:hypothetical protein
MPTLIIVLVHFDLVPGSHVRGGSGSRWGIASNTNRTRSVLGSRGPVTLGAQSGITVQETQIRDWKDGSATELSDVGPIKC